MNTQGNKTVATKKSDHIKIVRHVVPAEPLVSPSISRKDSFNKMSAVISTKLGSSTAFVLATLIIVVWAVSGPFFNYSDTWQLVINTSTTIITFLMVFAIQNTQNRDSRAMQLKLSELIKANNKARTEFLDIEDLSDTELDEIQAQFKELHEKFEKRKK